MKNQLQEIINKYELNEISKKIKKLDNQKIFIGFLGEFSSGKSSLINALIGENVLPVSSEPTTKTITIVEPLEELKSRLFFVNDVDNKQWKKCDSFEFASLATTTQESNIKIQTPTNGYLNSNFVFIDTPGLSSLDEADADITYGYLPYLDGAIIAQDINKGSLTKSIANFISNPNIKSIANNFIFVLTKKDNKSNDGTQRIVDNVIDAIRGLNEEHNIGLTEIHDKVVAVSSTDYMQKIDLNALNEFKKAMSQIIVSKYNKLKQERVGKELINIATSTIDALENIKGNLTLNDEELKEKEDINEKDIDKLKSEKEKYISNLEKFEASLSKKLRDIASDRIEEFKECTHQQEVESIMKQINDELNEIIKLDIEQAYEDLHISQPKSLGLRALSNKINNAIKTKQIATTTATAATTAFIGTASSILGNALEAGVGGAVSATSSKNSESNESKNDENNESENDKKKDAWKANLMMGLISGAKDIIKNINPYEYIGDMAKNSYISSSIKDEFNKIITNIVYNITEEIKKNIQENIFLKLESQIMQLNEQIEKSIKIRKEMRNEVVNYREKISDDIVALKILIKKSQG